MNSKKVSMKVLSVLLAAMLMLGVCVPMIGAITMQEVSEDESAVLAETTETLKAAAKKGYAAAYAKALENGLIDSVSGAILNAVEELEDAKAALNSYFANHLTAELDPEDFGVNVEDFDFSDFTLPEGFTPEDFLNGNFNPEDFGLSADFEIPEEFEYVSQYMVLKLELEYEIQNTITTLNAVNADLLAGNFAEVGSVWAAMLNYRDDVKAHLTAIGAIAYELGFDVAPYVDELQTAFISFGHLLETIVREAYVAAVKTDIAFKKAYKAFVAKAKIVVENIHPELVAPVAAFLNETADEALSIVHAYGEAAILKLAVDAAATAGELYDAAVVFAAVLKDYGKYIVANVLTMEDVDNAIAEIKSYKEQLRDLYELAKDPAADAAAVKANILALESALKSLAASFFDNAATALGNADLSVQFLFVESMLSVFDAYGIVRDAGVAYGQYLIGEAKAMMGEVLAVVLDNLKDPAAATLDLAIRFAYNIRLHSDDMHAKLDYFISICPEGAAKEQLKTMHDALIENAKSSVNGEYVMTEDSYYVALAGNPYYAELLAEALELGEDQLSIQTWGDIDYSEIAKADFITVGFDFTEVNNFAVNQLMAYVADYVDSSVKDDLIAHVEAALAKNPDADIDTEELVDLIDEALNSVDHEVVELDWAALLGENFANQMSVIDSIVNKLIAKMDLPETAPYTLDLSAISSKFAALGEDAKFIMYLPPASEAMTLAVQSYLYGYISFVKEYNAAMLQIHQVNPDATVAVLGHYNVFNGLDSKVTDLYQLVTVAASALPYAYALTMSDVVYVSIPQTETYLGEMIANGQIDATLVDVLLAYAIDNTLTEPSDAGHEYIVEQILSCIDVTLYVPETEPETEAPTEPETTEPEPETTEPEPETTEPEPETTEPEPETTEPEPETTEPEPETTEPEPETTAEPETEPEGPTEGGETEAPESEEPTDDETEAPETDAPETDAPETTAPVEDGLTGAQVAAIVLVSVAVLAGGAVGVLYFLKKKNILR